MPNPSNLNILTGSRANAMVADMKPANFDELKAGSITSWNAIGPVNAVDTAVIFGPQCAVVAGYRDTRILQHDKREIDDTLSETVKKTATIDYKLGRTLSIGVFDKTEVSGTRDIHVVGEGQETYDKHREIHEPFKWEFTTTKFEHTWLSVDTKFLSIEAAPLD